MAKGVEVREVLAEKDTSHPFLRVNESETWKKNKMGQKKKASSR